MSPRHKITFAASAIEDLGEVRQWYIDQEAAEAGDRLLREIISRIEPLADSPESGRIVPEFNVAHLRELIHPPYRIVYRLDRGRVRIVRVWRAERLLKMP